MPTTLRNYRRRQLSRNGHYAETGFGSADLRELIAARTKLLPSSIWASLKFACRPVYRGAVLDYALVISGLNITVSPELLMLAQF
ncbi:MAG: hypothetical protein DME45_11070 [Verrucomicrobia bacterium]|nr:MAG: hypothetical protein DME45_11070 [Verrucomicrobiota bacterium]